MRFFPGNVISLHCTLNRVTFFPRFNFINHKDLYNILSNDGLIFKRFNSGYRPQNNSSNGHIDDSPNIKKKLHDDMGQEFSSKRASKKTTYEGSNQHFYTGCNSLNLPINDSVSRIKFRSSRFPKNLIWTLPNALSVSRIALAPIIGFAIGYDRYDVALLLLMTSSATDFLDGWIARIWRQESALGSLLDPLGDKVTAAVLATLLAFKGIIPVPLFVLIVTRDFALIVASIFIRIKTLYLKFSKKSDSNKVSFFGMIGSILRYFFDFGIATPSVQPTAISKVNTFLQIILFISIISNQAFDLGSNFLRIFIEPLQMIVAGTTVASAYSYWANFRQVVRFLRP